MCKLPSRSVFNSSQPPTFLTQPPTKNNSESPGEVESYGTDIKRAEVMTKEEKAAFEKVKSSLVFTGSGYRLSVPWKENGPELPQNKEMALKRLESTERNLNSKDRFVKEEYQRTIKAYVEKGYLRKLSPKEKLTSSAWYLPLFPIVKLEKSTTKVRIVFDCAAQHEGVSSNDVINAGPKLQAELFNVLIRFRRNPVGIACDIKEMFLQIEIEEKDRPYFRILWRDYKNLLASKSKVAPLVPMTVPRLELMAAVVGLRLTQALIKVLEIPMSAVTFYSDSLDVLWWIRGYGKDFRAFVANRVGEIQMFTDPQQWQHVPTDQNPADLVSRGVSVEELKENRLWWNGPIWLLEEQDSWPKVDETIQQEAKERKKTTVLASRFTPVKPEDQQIPADGWRLSPSRYSSWIRLVRVQARVVRVLCNMKIKGKKIGSAELLPEEIIDAEEDMIRQAQFETFPEEYNALKNYKPIPPRNPLLKLPPRIDDNGIIRLEGRH